MTTDVIVTNTLETQGCVTTGLLNQSSGRMSIGNPEGWLVGSRLSCCEETSRFLRRVIHGKQLSVEGLEPGDLTPRGSLQGSKRQVAVVSRQVRVIWLT